jgi:hypothetical protein
MTHVRQPSLGVQLGLQSDSGFLILPGVLEMKVVSPRTPEMERMDRFYSDCSGDCSHRKRTLQHRLVALGTLRFTWRNVLPLKRSAYLSKLTRTAEVRHRAIRCLVNAPTTNPRTESGSVFL